MSTRTLTDASGTPIEFADEQLEEFLTGGSADGSFEDWTSLQVSREQVNAFLLGLVRSDRPVFSNILAGATEVCSDPGDEVEPWHGIRVVAILDEPVAHAVTQFLIVDRAIETV